MAKQADKQADKQAGTNIQNQMIAVPLWINAAAAVFAGLVAKVWEPDKLIVGHMHEAEIPEEVLQKAAEETKRSMQYFGEAFGLIQPKPKK